MSDLSNHPVSIRWKTGITIGISTAMLLGLIWPSLSGAAAWQVDPIGSIIIEKIARATHAWRPPDSLYTAILLLITVPIKGMSTWGAWALVIKGASVAATLAIIGLVMRRTRHPLIAAALLSTPGLLLAATSASPVMISLLGVVIARRTPGKSLRFLIWITALFLTLTAPNTLALAQWSEIICVPVGVAGGVLAVIRLGRKTTILDAFPTLVYAGCIGLGIHPAVNRPDMIVLGIGGLILTMLDRPFALNRRLVAAIGLGIGIQVLLSLPYYASIWGGQLRTAPYQSSIAFQGWHDRLPPDAQITVTSGIKIDYSRLRHPGHVQRAATGSELLASLTQPTTAYVLIDESDPMFLSKSPEIQGIATQIIALIQTSPGRWQTVATGPHWRLLKQGDE